MRITNSTVLRNYDRNLKRLGKNKYASEQKVFTGRDFSRASDNPLSAAKALTVRKQLSRTKQYKENLEVADKFYTEAETSMLQISEELATIRETIIYACNTTKDEGVDLQILSQQLDTYAREMVSILNTNSAERAIFGGESNAEQPFSLLYGDDGYATEVLYHGVPINAYDDFKEFPYSNEVYVDIGLGMVIDQETQEIDPQTGLRVSFNGAELTGCGSEMSAASIDLASLQNDFEYSIDVFYNGEKQTVKFTGGASEAESQANFQAALDKAFYRSPVIPTVDADGNITVDDGKKVYVMSTQGAENKATVDNEYTYSFNYIQITLDAAKALKNGEVGYANGCIDQIVEASENLLVEIANLGNMEEFIGFNSERYDTRELNLKERQDSLEASDLESEITLYKTYEALYNACLQMSSAIIPNTIFNYIR